MNFARTFEELPNQPRCFSAQIQRNISKKPNFYETERWQPAIASRAWKSSASVELHVNLCDLFGSERQREFLRSSAYAPDVVSSETTKLYASGWLWDSNESCDEDFIKCFDPENIQPDRQCASLDDIEMSLL